MSINLVNPETLLGKIDAAGNFVAQIRLAFMVGDRGRVEHAIGEAERHLHNAQLQIEDAPNPVLSLGEVNTFQNAIEHLINGLNKEAGSDTPDFILAEYLIDCLAAFDKAVKRRSDWYAPPQPQCEPPEGAK